MSAFVKKKEPRPFSCRLLFQITKEERGCLRSQIATFAERTRDRKYLPYVYTEQGIIALVGPDFDLVGDTERVI